MISSFSQSSQQQQQEQQQQQHVVGDQLLARLLVLENMARQLQDDSKPVKKQFVVKKHPSSKKHVACVEDQKLFKRSQIHRGSSFLKNNNNNGSSIVPCASLSSASLATSTAGNALLGCKRRDILKANVSTSKCIIEHKTAGARMAHAEKGNFSSSERRILVRSVSASRDPGDVSATAKNCAAVCLKRSNSAPCRAQNSSAKNHSVIAIHHPHCTTVSQAGPEWQRRAFTAKLALQRERKVAEEESIHRRMDLFKKRDERLTAFKQACQNKNSGAATKSKFHQRQTFTDISSSKITTSSSLSSSFSGKAVCNSVSVIDDMSHAKQLLCNVLRSTQCTQLSGVSSAWMESVISPVRSSPPPAPRTCPPAPVSPPKIFN